MKEKLSIKEQLHLVHDKCPNVWEDYRRVYCPSAFGLMPEKECALYMSDKKYCRECWDKALEEK